MKTRLLALTLLVSTSAFAGYDCEIGLAKTKSPSKLLGALSISQPAGSDSSANWGRLRTEKTARNGDVTVIELGGWVDATARDEGAKFSVYRSVYAGTKLLRQDFLLPIQIDGTYDRLAEFEGYTIRVNCGVK
jgi:hypothetical protein